MNKFKKEVMETVVFVFYPIFVGLVSAAATTNVFPDSPELMQCIIAFGIAFIIGGGAVLYHNVAHNKKP